MNNNIRNNMKAESVIKRIMGVNLSIIFLITTLLPGFTNVSYAYENENNTIRGNNSFIEYLMDKNDGRFVIRTLEGIPQKISDDNKKLLFERENDPETSFTTFRVNGDDYIFGNKYSGHSDYIDKSLITSDGLYTQSQWTIDSIKVNQILEIIEDPEHPNVGNVRIRYEVTNESDTAKSVGSRIFLDTMLGDNDGSSFIVSGGTITNETQLSGNDVPDYYRSSDDDFAPKVIGYGFLKGWGEKTPDKVVFAHYNNLSKTKWDYTVDPGIDFTTNNNIFEGADSSVAYYFNEESLSPNETRVYETFYGIGDFSHYNSESDYAVLVNAPDKLSVNADKTGYVEDEFIVTVTVDNTLPQSKNLTNVNIMMLKKDSVFSEVESEDYSIQIPSILKNEIKTFEFKLSAKNAQSFISEAIRVDVTSDNNINPVTSFDYILIPAVGGELPNLRMEAIAPSNVYYEGYREFSIKGKGFNMLTNKGLWELYLIDSNNKMLEIPDESISVENDEKLSITIYEDTLSESTPVGDYRFKIVHSDEIIGTVASPKDKPITFSSDKKYQSRPYGVLYVEKRNKDDNYTYHTAVVDSKDILDEIKISLGNNNGVPDKYSDTQKDVSYGPVEEIVLDIVGDVSQLTAQDNSKYYTVKTNSQSAIINSVIQYKDGDKPLEIRKTNGIITIEGDGTLQIVNNNEFWWTSFYTYIADGEDYEMNEIIEEDDESEKSNIVIDFFDPGKILTSLTKAFFDGFEVEIRSVILLNEGASFGGKVSVEVPYGAPVPEEEEEKTPEQVEAEEEDTMFEALSDLFLTDEEREAKTKKQNRSKAYLKILALLLTEDAIVDKIHELRENWSAPPSEKAEVIYDIILQSPELLLTIQAAIGGKEIEEEDDEDRKSVGVTIDVKKVIVGKKYGDDYIYDSIRFIGIDAEGEVKVTLPFGSKEDRKEAGDNDETQGVVAKVAINTIEGEYSIEADVNMKLANAHAIISIVKVDDRLVPDHLELSGGFEPGVPIAPPFYINKLGGGVKNLAGQFGKKDSGPLTIILILGINFQPTFEGEFRTEITKNGFSLEGDLGFKNGGMKIFERVAIALQWSRPRYFEAEADVDLFNVISGNAYIFVGERKDGNSYKFYFEGRVEAGIRIPDDIWLVGGKEIGSAQLGVSTEKFWGHIEVIGIGVGITYVYGKGLNFASNDMENGLTYASLTNVKIPEYSMDRKMMSGDHRLIIGSNIRPINNSKVTYAYDDSNPYNYVVASIEDNYIGDSINSFSGIYNDIYAGTIDVGFTYELVEKDNAILEYIYTGELPNLTITDPSGNPYILVENENYLLKTLAEENSESGLEEKHLFISIIEPENGLWTVQSDSEIEEVGIFEALSMPEFESISFTNNGEDINVNFTSKNYEEALVSLFMVNVENGSEAGYALLSNIDAALGSANVKIPEGAVEGTYKIRATIQHPDYGYDEIISTETITITDPYKPSDIEELNVSCIGDGYLKATWNPIAEEGEIQYSVSVYNEVPVWD